MNKTDTMSKETNMLSPTAQNSQKVNGTVYYLKNAMRIRQLYCLCIYFYGLFATEDMPTMRLYYAIFGHNKILIQLNSQW